MLPDNAKVKVDVHPRKAMHSGGVVNERVNWLCRFQGRKWRWRWKLGGLGCLEVRMEAVDVYQRVTNEV